MAKIMRWDIVNWLIENNKYKRYLEIGTATGKNLSKIKCDYKVGVEPFKTCQSNVCNKFFKMKSDDFFWQNEETFDIIFIDGYHIYQQSKTDLLNALECLNDDGIICMHDCGPRTEADEKRGRCWDSWKTIADVRQNLNGTVVACVVDTDFGVGVVQANKKIKKGDLAKDIKFPLQDLTYRDLDKDRSITNTVSWEKFIELMK